ncbi:hypothetical protein [Anaerovibrio sp.]|uniref:hypothetical protein n=1 Tax=Anaerovibrio sp. TaxID=1872532 RepID=UPI00389012C5
MVKATFENFLEKYPNYQSLKDDMGAKAVFEMLSTAESISASVKAIEDDEPALLPHVRVIEYLLANCKETTLDLNNDFHKQGIGRMQCAILEGMGYEPNVDKKLPKWCNEHIKEAMCYDKQ